MPISKRILKDIISSALLLFLMVSFLFILLRIAPGDPSLKFVSPGLSPELSHNIRINFGIDRPLFEQYFLYVKNLFSGELGISYTYRVPVLEVIGRYLPFTLLLGFISFIVQIISALLLAYAGLKKKGYLDKGLEGLSLIIYSIPTFVIGVLLILVFNEKLKLLPSSGVASLDNESLPVIERITDYLRHLILPLITISAGGAALFYRYLRDNINEVINKQFVLNLRTYGMNENKIILKHILPNALNPVISAAGVELGVLLSGLLITEVMFSLPGMGRLTLEAVLSRDYPLVCGCTLITGLIMIITNFSADIIKSKVNKRYLAEQV